jgi:hypothetical protein
MGYMENTEFQQYLCNGFWDIGINPFITLCKPNVIIDQES